MHNARVVRLTADPQTRALKQQVAERIITLFDRGGLSARAAAATAAIDPADVQRIRNTDLDRFSLDRLIRIAGRLGLRIELKISPLREVPPRREVP